MGYTHYYTQRRDFDQKEWEQICLRTLDVLEHCEKNQISLKYEYDSEDVPEVSNSMIRFNGEKDLGHETFEVKKQNDSYETNSCFNFTKTARKPYDLACCLVLLVIGDIAPDAVEFGTDGEWDQEWTESRKIYEELFSKKAPNILDKAAA